MMWGGKVSLPRRERFCAANTTEIAAMAGQKILFSGRGSITLCTVWTLGTVTKINNGAAIKAKTHAEIGMIAHLSIVGVEALGRPNSQECIEALDILALLASTLDAVLRRIQIVQERGRVWRG
jgi:hypothetical protein